MGVVPLIKLGLMCWILGALSAMANAQCVSELTFYTESDASLNYLVDGELAGPAVELLLAVCDELGTPLARDDIRVVPWPRAYHSALAGPNIVLFSTMRTVERENLFQWAGPIATEHDVLVALRSRKLAVQRPGDLKSLRIGAVRDDVGLAILTDHGVPESNIFLASQAIGLGKMLTAGRIDAWIFGEMAWRRNIRTARIDPGKIEVIHRFAPNRYYFAFSKDVDPLVVLRFQQALDKMLATGRFGLELGL